MKTLLTVLQVRLGFSAFLLSLLLGPISAAQAPNNPADPNAVTGLDRPTGKEQVRVIGHLPLERMHVNQMFVEQRGDKVYLYLHRPTKQAYAVVDVTNPSKPTLLSRNALKAQGAEVEGPATGSVLAITVKPENESGANEAAPQNPLPTETVELVDMSDPKNVKPVKTFKGVTAMYPDDSRKLVYLVNGEGLWIVSHRMTHPLPLCNSEAALTPEPDCM